MKVGMKIYSTQFEKMEVFCEFADYVEILVVPSEPIEKFRDFDFPYRIHAAHQGFGVNLADPKQLQHNMDAISQAIAVAELLDSPTVVIHPGDGPKAEALSQLAEIKKIETSRKLLLENLPKKPGHNELMNFPEEAGEFLALGFGLCLDIGHAAGASAFHNRDYEEDIRGFMGFKPEYFHVSNGLTESDYDLHMPLMEGDFDLPFFKGQILSAKNPWVTLETPYNPLENKKDFKYFKEVL